VLVDCGSGPDGDLGLGDDDGAGDGVVPGGYLLASLGALGVAAREVTDVVLTHLHWDHTGWLARDGAPVFPAATVHVGAADVAFFTDPATPGVSARCAPERLAAVADHLAPFAGSGPLLPGVDALAAPGHTPGSTALVASDGTRRVVFLGDVVHCPVQLVEAEWAAMSDVDPVQARRTREHLTRELDGAAVAGAHFPGLALGRLLVGERPRRWVV